MSDPRGQLNAPGLTAIVPAYNAGHLIYEAIRSLTGQGLNVVVVDDGSTDNTAQVALEAGATVIRHPENRGVADAINTGVQAANTDLVMLLDADDQLRPGSVRLLVEAAEKHPDVSVFIPDVEMIAMNGDHINHFRLQQPILDVHRLLAMDGIPQRCGIVYRRHVLVGHPYKPVLVNGRLVIGVEDWQNWIELALAGIQAMRVEGASGAYRRRLGSVSMNVTRMRRSGLAVLTNPALRHPDCAACGAAVAMGMRALREYCLSMDVVHLKAGGGAKYAVGMIRRDPRTALRVAHMYAWTTRDRLKTLTTA